MMKQSPVILALGTFLCFANLSAIMVAQSPSASFKEISYPDSVSTSANSINDANKIVGFYLDQDSNYHGYTYLDGTYTTIDPPGSTSTLAFGINDSGVIVGEYSTTGKAMGFIDKDGDYSDVVYPDSSEQGTDLNGINNAGVMVGSYWVTNSKNETQMYGFIYENGKFTKLQYPGAYNTMVNAINDNGIVIGSYGNSNGDTNGFTYQNGKYTAIIYPGDSGGSSASDMTDSGVLIGGYTKNSYGYGFELADGKYTTIYYDPDKDTYTALTGINKAGYIVGNYGGAGNPPYTNGFLRTP